MKKLLYLIFLFPLIFLTSCNNENYDIISSNFAGYDIAKNIVGDKMSTGMLLNPGEELHDYSPSISDIERIANAKIFIYLGGESDEWVESDVLNEIDQNKTKVIKMMDLVTNLLDEENPESSDIEESEEEEEYDEHIWNSISNEKKLVTEINKIIGELDNVNKNYYNENCNNYIAKLNEVDENIKGVLNNTNKRLLIFADRFPLLYFVKEYNLEYDAAFKGCDSSKEASYTTIEKLTSKVEENNIKVIFVIELSESNIADTIINNCKEDGFEVKKLTFYTMHNVSKDDFEKGLTYVDFMNKNIESLKEALL